MLKVAIVLLLLGASAWVAAATVFYASHHKEGRRYYAHLWPETEDGYPPHGI